MFRYAWQEKDRVSIELPENFELDNAESPGSLGLGAPGGYSLRITVEAKKRLVVERELTFGNKGALNFNANAYALVKSAFDGIHSRDTHTLSLRMTAGTK